MSEKGKGDGQNFVFPKDILEKINECSFGGFLLFCFNEDGEPEVFSRIDNNVNAMALQYFVRNWSKSLDEASIETSKAQLLGDNDVDAQEGDEEEF